MGKGEKKIVKSKAAVEWCGTQVSNLVRRGGAVYYAQLKIEGKTYRRSLGTAKLEVAKLKLHLVLNEIRAEAVNAVAYRADGLGAGSGGSGGSGGGLETLRGCLGVWLSREGMRPDLKSSTKAYNVRRAESLMRMLPVDVPVGKVSVDDFRQWWKATAEAYNPTYANNCLSIARGLVEMQVQAGLLRVNPLKDFKWLRIPKVIKDEVSGEQMMRLIADIRSQGARSSVESADMVSMMAFTGMRPGEVARLTALDLREDVIMVRMTEEGTKNYKERSVPIMAELREVVDRRRAMVGKIWSIKSPENAMRRACRRLGFGFVVTRYDCRHFFATRCIESGVDIPTVAKWLGHSDGGITLMKRYSHVTDAHGLEAARRVKF